MSREAHGALFLLLGSLLFAAAWNALGEATHETMPVSTLCAALAGFCLSLAVYFFLI